MRCPCGVAHTQPVQLFVLVGAVTVLVWQHYQWFKLYEIVPGFVLSTVAIVMVSLLGKMPSAAVQKTHAEVEAEIAAQGE